MGSQTLEILRQGIWASFTGGWFFDPHQEIFCNTFHMYLWLCLLLTPFILHLTVTSVIIPTVLYPTVIFILFSMLKFINHKLHILFDGEELLEEDKNKEGDDDAVETPHDEQQQGEANDPSDLKLNSGNSANNIPVPYTNDLLQPDLGISLKDEIEDALKKAEGNKSETSTGRLSTPEVPDNSQSNAELVTTTPTCSPVERAFVVDLQCTKTEYQDKDENGQTAAVTSEVNAAEPNTDSATTAAASDVVPEVSDYVDEKNDDNLIIANKPTVSNELENIPSIAVKSSSKGSQSFPLSSSTESSWGSSSESSTFSDELVSPRVKFMPIDPTEATNKENENKDLSGNSEIVLSTRKKEVHASDDKAVSLPALEVKDKDGSGKKHNRSGARRRSNNHVGFSLQEIEKSTMMKDDSQNIPGTSKSDPDKIMSVNKETDDHGSPRMDVKMFSLLTDNVSNPTDDKITPNTNRLGEIIRTGAIRGSTSAGGLRSSGARSYSHSSRQRQRTNSASPATSLLRQESDPNSDADLAKHLAISYEDTSTGAVHCFQDEFGQWYTYTFGEESALQPIPRSFITDSFSANMLSSTTQRRDSNTSSLLSHQDIARNLRNPIPDDDFSILPVQWRTHPFYAPHMSGTSIVKVEEPAPNKYYMLPVIGSYAVKVSFDRLKLLALLDRNKSKAQSAISVLLATLVAYLGYELLSRNFFYDFWLFVICFVIAKCQFSLLKSVQPDSASPIHGHNNTIVFSRSVYFCVVAVLIILIDDASSWSHETITLYTIPLYSKATLIFARDLMIGFLLAFPLIFLLGLLPQVNTFMMHCIEQFDIHIFGGSAMTSLLASIYAFFRAVVCVFVMSIICYIPLKITDKGKPRGQHVLFSIFCGMLLAVSYHLSRSTSSPEILWKALKQSFCCKMEDTRNSQDDISDPLPEKLLKTVKARLLHDMIVCVAIGIFVFAVHVSTAFTTLQPTVSYVLYAITGIVGVVTHYVFPQLRKQLPWLFISSPVLKPYEYNLYEWQEHSRIMWFERVYVCLAFVEKNVLYPVVWLSAVTRQADEVCNKFGEIAAAIIVTVTSLKFLRASFTNTPRQHVILIWTVLFFEFDYRGYSESFLIDYFFMAIFVEKMTELYLKFKFILTYTAPWQITWGSAFHAFAQPVSVPHCGMLMVQALVSAFFSAPLNPFLGSAIFMTSYMRPIKFWEKDYNTKRVDHSNTRLSSHIDSNPGADDNNLNSIFYEHLTRSLQHSLCGDLALGRWGNFSSGDCFIMASDYLNALVHIIEVGNGYVTFQLRGLEFRGTYCQQREVEAITEFVDDDEGCCCFHPGHLKNLLSFNAAFGQRWLAWEVVQSKYILEGYSVSDNTAVTMFQMFDLRKIFITYYVTSIVFYCVRNEKLLAWISDDTIMNQLEELKSSSYVDLDTVFRPVTDKDYDLTNGGVTRHSFCQSYHDWLICCNRHRPEGEQIEDDGVDSRLVTLCFALSLLGRRLLSTASNNQWNAALKSFLHGLHALFKGDFRVTASKDEWVFADPDLALLRMVVAPAVRMALKLHQDHFTCVDEFEDNDVLYENISSHEQQFVICHEGHPAWRQAVLNNRSNLLALRYVIDDGTDDYKIIMLNRRCLNFRVIKVNKECVRGLWAGQLQELIFLRNRNPERGSIQNAKQALRNMINSSCDQPIGYPIYVSPLTTSYSESNPFYSKVCVGNVNGTSIRNFFSACYQSLLNQYAGHCQGGSNRPVEIEMSTYGGPDISAVNKADSSRHTKGHTPIKSVIRTGSYTSIPSSSNHSTTTASSHGDPSETVITTVKSLLNFPSVGKAQITNVTRVTEALDSGLHTRLHWPNHISWLRERCSAKHWDCWFPREGMVGDILYLWKPNDEDKYRRSHLNKTIYLLRIEDCVVPVLQDGVALLGENVEEIKV